MLGKIIDNWKQRHKTRLNFFLHMAGIPMTICAVVPLVQGRTALAGLLFGVGYILQFIGHAHEKSEVGEFVWVKKIFKSPSR